MCFRALRIVYSITDIVFLTQFISFKSHKLYYKVMLRRFNTLWCFLNSQNKRPELKKGL